MTFTYPSHTTKGCVPLSSDVNDSNNHKENQNILQLYYVEDTAVIDQYNILAFNTQCREKAGYVVSHNKQILEELRKRTNENINGGQI